MRNFLWVAGMVLMPFITRAQNNYTAVIRDAETNKPLTGATVAIQNTNIAGSTNAQGRVILSDIPDGKAILIFRFIGYEQRTDTLDFPRQNELVAEVFLKPSAAEELEEVTISSTRSSRSIKDIPTRVEFIAGEELEEKGNMKPGDIRMVLAESTGIQTQQTSATSANASIRIQGLDGRYTQILKDGFPLYSGAASGLGLLQIPPLDLKQVEIIKGSSSTLYGGGAIAGMVNLISKTPQEERELRFHANGTSANGLDLNAFYAQKFRKTGTTLFASYNTNKAYDPANIDLSVIPKFERLTVNPTLFFYPSKKTSIRFGLNTTLENRTGGDIHYIEGNGDSIHRYFENNKTRRFSTQLSAVHDIGVDKRITIKNSLSYFNRVLSIPGYTFNGTQYSTFTEANFNARNDKLEWIGGVNLLTDRFNEKPLSAFALRNYNQVTAGAFIQNTWKAKEWLHLETGFRTDYVVDYGYAFLPRISALFKISPPFTSRLGGGLGYKAPTIFTEESERIQYRNVLPINPETNRLEKSYGANWDFNYRTSLADGSVTLNINQLFFYTFLNNPLLLVGQQNGTFQFNNINGHTISRGGETNVKIGYADFKLFLGYTYTNARIDQNGERMENPLTPKHRLNTVLMYEMEDKWKLGLEAYTFSRQKLNDGQTGKAYAIFGFMAEKLWEKFSLYINFENFSDTRQTRFDTIYTGPVSNPVFRDIYAPLDGFVVNGGIKLKL